MVSINISSRQFNSLAQEITYNKDIIATCSDIKNMFTIARDGLDINITAVQSQVNLAQAVVSGDKRPSDIIEEFKKLTNAYNIIAASNENNYQSLLQLVVQNGRGYKYIFGDNSDFAVQVPSTQYNEIFEVESGELSVQTPEAAQVALKKSNDALSQLQQIRENITEQLAEFSAMQADYEAKNIAICRKQPSQDELVGETAELCAEYL